VALLDDLGLCFAVVWSGTFGRWWRIFGYCQRSYFRNLERPQEL
jgi:hypothetical protein